MKMMCPLCEKLTEGSSLMTVVRQSLSTSYLDENQFYLGKAIVVFNRHEEDLLHLSEKERVDFYCEMMRVAEAISRAVKPDRMNYSQLGNVVHHLHWHVIPRYKSDRNFGAPPVFDAKKVIERQRMIRMVKSIGRFL